MSVADCSQNCICCEAAENLGVTECKKLFWDN